MAQIVKGTIGDQPVELNNAATEATLVAMLNLAKQDSAVLREMAKKAGVDAAAIKKAQEAMEKQAQAGASAGKGMGDVAPKASLLGGFLMDMGQSVMATGKNLMQFGDELLEGKARASDLFKAFKDLPLGLGLLASIFEKAMKYQEKNLDIYQQISKSGAGLSGSLTDLRTTAAGLYMTLDDYAEVVSKNADVMNRLGGSATLGHKNFDAINKNLMQGHLGTELLELGYSFKDVNNMLGSYLRVSNDAVRYGKDASKEQERLAIAAANYGKELDFMSRLTGESREAMQAKMEQESMEASWQMKLSEMTAEQREKAQSALMRAQALGGKGAVDALKASIMGYAAPFSDAGRMFVSTMHDGTKAIKGMAGTVLDNTKAEEASKKMNKMFADGMAGNIKDMKSLKNVIFAMGQGGTESAEGLMDIVKAANAFRAQGMSESKAIQKAMEETQQRAEADKRAAAAAVANEKAMKVLSNLVNTALAPVMEMLAKYGNELVHSFTSFVKNVDFAKLGHGIKELTENVVEYVKFLFNKEGREKILNDVKDLFKQLIIELKLALNPFYSERDAQLDRNKMLLNDRIMEAKAKEAQAVEQRNELNQKIYDAEHKSELENANKKMADEAKALKDKKDRTEQEDARLKVLNSAMEENTKRLKASAYLLEPKELEKGKKQLSEFEANVKSAHQDTVDYTDRYNRYAKQGFDPEKVKEDKSKWDYETGRKKMYGGTPSYGSLLENFGKGTSAELHGKEAVLNEAQLLSMAKGTYDAGTAQAQEKLANAILALNKQQAMTNQILERIADYTRRGSEVQGRWGNAFARV